MTIPDYQSLMLPVLSMAAQGEVRIAEVVDRLSQQLALTPEERSKYLPSGKQTVFNNRVHWAKFYLSRAGLVESERHGYFKITEQGRRLLSTCPVRIDKAVLSQFGEYQVSRERSRPATQPDPTLMGVDGTGQIAGSLTETPDEIMRAVHKQIEAALAQDILERIRIGSPGFFERLIVGLLVRMNYGGLAGDAGRALGRTGDDGVDGVIDQDALGLDRVYIQAKRYASGNNVGSGAIRDFFGGLDRHKASKGVFVTTSMFSASARETAEYLSKRIVLVDGDQLAKLMIKYDVRCRIEETMHIKEIDDDFFEGS